MYNAPPPTMVIYRYFKVLTNTVGITNWDLSGCERKWPLDLIRHRRTRSGNLNVRKYHFYLRLITKSSRNFHYACPQFQQWRGNPSPLTLCTVPAAKLPFHSIFFTLAHHHHNSAVIHIFTSQYPVRVLSGPGHPNSISLSKQHLHNTTVVVDSRQGVWWQLSTFHRTIKSNVLWNTTKSLKRILCRDLSNGNGHETWNVQECNGYNVLNSECRDVD
jgi:hypothetical protein